MTANVAGEQQPRTALAVLPRSAISTILAGDKDDTLGQLSRKVAEHPMDASTEKGRKSIRSLAAEVASVKMNLVRIAEKQTEEWRKNTAAVNAEKRVLVERMDGLKADVLAPVLEYEAIESTRVEGHQAALSQMENTSWFDDLEPAAFEIQRRIQSIAEQMDSRNWQEFRAKAAGMADRLLASLRAQLDRQVKREAERAELARLQAAEAERRAEAAAREREERDRRLAENAAAAAKAAAEAEAQRKLDEAAAQAEAQATREREAAAAALREAEGRVHAAEAARLQAIADAEAARLAAIAEAEAATAQALRDQEAAVEAERKRAAALAADAERERLAQAEIARLREEADAALERKRSENRAHRQRRNKAALDAIVALGVSEEQGRAIIVAIASNSIPHVTINYGTTA